MDRSRQRIVRYNNWGRGEYGNISPDRAPAGSFDAENMVVYESGIIGPRAGLNEFAFTGVEANPVWGIFWRGTTPDLAVGINDAVFRYDTLTPGAQDVFSGFLTGTPSGDYPAQGFEFDNRYVYFTVYGDQSYVLDFVDGTLTALTDSPGGVDTCLYGERMIVAGDTSDVGQIFYSAALDFNDWPAENFIEIGNASGAVTGVWAQRGYLTLQTQNGEWWVLTGVPGTGTLRRVSGGGVHPWTAFTDGAELIGDDTIINVPISADYPARFNGAVQDDRSWRHLRINDGNPQLGFGTVKVIHGFRADEAVVIFPGTAGNNRVGLFRNGVWTFHTFEVELSEYAISDRQGRIFFTDGGSSGVAPRFFQWYLPLDRPSTDADDFADAADPDAAGPRVVGRLAFPEDWVEDGSEQRVRQVIIDFLAYDLGDGENNTFDVYIDSLSLFGEVPKSTADPDQFVEATGLYDATGTRLRHVINFGDEVMFGGGFQLRIENITGVAFEGFTIVTEARPAVPRF